MKDKILNSGPLFCRGGSKLKFARDLEPNLCILIFTHFQLECQKVAHARNVDGFRQFEKVEKNVVSVYWL